MDINFGSVNQTILPQTAGGGVTAPGTAAAETSASKVSAPEGSAPKPPTGWTPHAVGSSELAQVTGEERVDETKLRRDDDLGKLTRKAFDPETAAAALPTLDVEEGTHHRDTVMKGMKDVYQAMIDSSYETSKTIIDNMVDSPEERAAQAAREAERRAKEFDEKTRREERAEKDFQNALILDEIADSRIG